MKVSFLQITVDSIVKKKEFLKCKPNKPMNSKIKLFNLILWLSYVVMLFIGCSKEENDIEQDSFYKNALKSATVSSIQGIWSLYEVEFNGRTVSIPNENMQCDRNFFIYNASGVYQEYVINSSFCTPKILEYNWSIVNGVITITSGFDNQELVVTALNNDKLVFKAKADIDEDGVEEVLNFTARKYSPIEKGFYANSIFWDVSNENYDKIKLSWLPYAGFGNFERYEIYRSGSDCNKFNSTLIGTVDEKNTNFFIDDNPPVEPTLCYYYKIFTDKGILAESELVYIPTNQLQVPSVTLSTPIVSGETIQLNWAEFQGYYFSHYEIKVQNFRNTTGVNHFSEVVIRIDDVKTTSYTDISPPYYTNPFYTVLVYDKFGNTNVMYQDPLPNTKEAIYKRPELLDFESVTSIAMDPDSPYLYLYGSLGDGNASVIQKYNYITKTVEAFTNNPIPYGFTDIKLTLTSNGKEIIVPFSGELRVYNSENLAYKYSLKPNATYYSFENFISLPNDIWGFVSFDTIYTYKRDNANLTLIDQKSLPSTTYTDQNIDIIKLGNDQILVGRRNAYTSILVNVSNDGYLSEGILTDFGIKSTNSRKTVYNAIQNVLISLSENRVYSAETFSLSKSFEIPYFSTGVGTTGNLIFGTNNDLNINIEDLSRYEKKVYVLNLTTNQITTYNSKV